MSANQQTEMKLVEVYNQELTIFVDRLKAVGREGKESSKRFLQDMQRKIDIFAKQVSNYKDLFPDDQAIQFYESRVYFFQGCHKIFSGMIYELYPGMFSPSISSELYAALTLFEHSLQISESSMTRRMKVFCYRQLNDKKNALRELNFILEHYADDPEVYVLARKEKDELETPTSSGLSRFLRSIF